MKPYQEGCYDLSFLILLNSDSGVSMTSFQTVANKTISPVLVVSKISLIIHPHAFTFSYFPRGQLRFVWRTSQKSWILNKTSLSSSTFWCGHTWERQERAISNSDVLAMTFVNIYNKIKTSCAAIATLCVKPTLSQLRNHIIWYRN